MSFSIYAWSEPRTTPYAPALRQHLSLVTLRQTAWGHIASPLSHCSVHVLRAPARPSAFHAASTMKTASGGLGAAKGLVEMPLASSMPQKHDADVHSQACLQEQHADGWDESKHAAPQTPLILLLAASGRKEGTVCQAQVSPASPQPGHHAQERHHACHNKALPSPSQPPWWILCHPCCQNNARPHLAAAWTFNHYGQQHGCRVVTRPVYPPPPGTLVLAPLSRLLCWCPLVYQPLPPALQPKQH